ncbi:selenocysteine-specific translation elongation factor [Lichenibacterium minor]|uniref:Selenocysteine-specific elongation factor n=1 Tax=Lichenibacterium minor TaxID=2316528 RepID=A0A4Q2UAB5_9HYPH|nr:selenocysteine-specific translation elongation factor [Lichenibacterium minor]RYC33492.1 selenocysteine-specific translation elongation factor [Lichenibacterium minor]
MIVGTAGHVDHGKTALVRALTGTDTDRLPEEKKRGITIDLGFAYLPTGDGDALGFVDVPGHERFVGTMVAGATGIDLLLLIVAADDGVMPQTREHLAIADLLGLRRALVVMSKADLADAERRAAVEAEIRGVLAGTALADAPVLPVSTVTGENVEALKAALDAERAARAGRDGAGRFRLAVDRSFVLAGAGTVVTGTVLSGSVAVGDRVTLSPSGTAARVRSLHAQNHAAERGLAGQRCALNLAGVERAAVRRGDVALDPSLHAPTDRIDVRLRVLPGEPKPTTTWLPVRLHHGASDVAARLVPLAADGIAPGAEGFAQLVLEHPIAAAAGDRFVLRDTSARRTLGGGTLLDLRPPARKRRTPERLAQLDALSEPAPERAVARLLDLAPFTVDLTGFCRDRALAADAPDALARHLGLVALRVGDGVTALSAARWDAYAAALAEALAAFHAENPDLQGLGSERLRLQLEPRLPRPVYVAALARLVEAGRVATEGSWVRLPDHVARLSPADEALWARIAPLVAKHEERFRPPRVRDVAGLLGAAETEVRRVCKLVGRSGRIDQVAHDHFFTRATVSEMAAIVADLSGSAGTGEFTAAQFRDRVENGRKVAIQILEFFDRHGLTMRRGDLRRLNPHRADLFGAP